MNRTTTSIALQGVTRHTPYNLSVDGECCVLHNFRLKGGALHPVGSPPVVAESHHEIVCIHAHASYKNLIAYHEGVLYWEGVQHLDQSITCQPVALANVEGVQRVEWVGNTLVVITDSAMEYALFDGEQYNYMGVFAPQVTLQFKSNDNIGTQESETFVVPKATPHEVVSGEINKVLSERREEGRLVYPTVACYAFRLYDGSYIHHSSPSIVGHKDAPQELLKCRCNPITEEETEVTICYKSYALYYQIEDFSQIPTDIVKGIDLFIAPLVGMELDTPLIYDSGAIALHPYSNSQLSQQVGEINALYRVGQIDCEKMVKDSAPIDLSGLLDVLEMQPYLPINDCSHHSTTAGCSYVYNAKLHLGDVTTTLYEGHPITHLLSAGIYLNGSPVEQLNKRVSYAEVRTLLATSGGTAIVVSRLDEVELNDLNPLLSYPDYRAFKMVISYVLHESGAIHQRSFELTPSTTLNIAYYIEPALKPIALKAFATVTELDSTTLHTCYRVPNLLKVSATENPFVFPVEQSYTVSGSPIVAMATATQALSQGQFGAFPLYVFTSDGVWAMEVGDGEVIYLTATPISREVCSCGSSVVAIDNAVAFATNRAINLIQGAQVISISEALWGDDKGLQPLSPISLTMLDQLLDHPLIGYNYRHNELWVASAACDYTYVYALDSGSWSTRSVVVEHFVTSYPHLYYYCEEQLWAASEQSEVANSEAILLTRPIKLGSSGYKRLDGVLLHLDLVADGVEWQVWGSNDGCCYTSIVHHNEYKEVEGEAITLHSLGTRMVGCRYRYFVVGILLNTPQLCSVVSHLECSFSNAYNNKLR